LAFTFTSEQIEMNYFSPPERENRDNLHTNIPSIDDMIDTFCGFLFGGAK